MVSRSICTIMLSRLNVQGITTDSAKNLDTLLSSIGLTSEVFDKQFLTTKYWKTRRSKIVDSC